MVFSDDRGLPVTVELVDSTTNLYKIVDDCYPLNFSIGQVGKYNGFAIDIDGVRWYFTNQTEYPRYYYYSAYGRITRMEKAETAIYKLQLIIFRKSTSVGENYSFAKGFFG